MSLITFFISRMLEKEKKDKDLILSYQCFNSLDTLNSDVASFHYLTYNTLLPSEDRDEIYTYYQKAKAVSNGFIKLARIFRWKKAKKYSWTTDLYMVNDLTALPARQTISILSNKTLYYFRLTDIMNIWKASLLRHTGLFSEPRQPKNPHTNQPFELHNLYNFYFAFRASNFHIPLSINGCFQSHFNLTKFRVTFFCLLREKTIVSYFNEASNYELYEYICTFLVKLKNDIGHYYIPQSPTIQEQTATLHKMTHFVLLYLRSTLSCNPVIREINNKQLIEQLIEFVDNRDNSDILHRIRSREVRPLGRTIPRPPPMPRTPLLHTRPPPPPPLPQLPPPLPLIIETPPPLPRPPPVIPPFSRSEVFTPHNELRRTPPPRPPVTRLPSNRMRLERYRYQRNLLRFPRRT